MRLAFLTGVYRGYAAAVYERHPNLSQQPFAVQHQTFLRDGFSWNGAWSGALGRRGHDVLEVYSNVLPMQRAWAAERAFSPRHDVRLSVAREQIRRFKPDALLIDDLRNFSGAWLAALRDAVPEIECVIGHIGSPWYDIDAVRQCDAVLCVTRAYQDAMRRSGVAAYFFRHAFNKDVLTELTRPPESASIIFCGNFLRGSIHHGDRERLFELLVDKLPVVIHAPQSELSAFADVAGTTGRRALYAVMSSLKKLGIPEGTLRRLPAVGKAATWSFKPISQLNPSLRPHMRRALYGSELYAALSSSPLTVNVHGAAAGDEAVNIRLFEATGVGACLLTDAKSDLREIFDEGREVLSFRSDAEALELAEWLLNDPEARREIAAAGQKRTLRDHTFDNRAPELESIIATVA